MGVEFITTGRKGRTERKLTNIFYLESNFLEVFTEIKEIRKITWAKVWHLPLYFAFVWLIFLALNLSSGGNENSYSLLTG